MGRLPFWFPTKRNIVWYIVFIGLFLLSLDYWNWYQSKPLIFGLPYWVIYILVLILSTGVAFYVFTLFYWRDAP